MFSFEQLQSFCTTLEEGSFSQAARKLKKDRTTVREHVKALEDSYALTLFVIKGKAAQPTDAALSLYQHAKLMVKSSQRLEKKLYSAPETAITCLDIHHDTLIPTSLIAAVEVFLAEHYPLTKVNWWRSERDHALQAVNSHSHHLAFTHVRLSSMPQYPVGWVNLGFDSIHVYCGAAHPLAAQSTVSAQELHLVKQYINKSLIDVYSDLFANSIELRIVEDNAVLMELVKHSGWTATTADIAQHAVARGEIKKLHVQELASSIKLGIGFYYPEALHDTNLISALVTFLKSVACEYYK